MENENRTDLRPETEVNEEGNITVKKNKTADFFAKLFCLLLAFFIWYYAVSTDTAVYEKEVLSLPVVIENKTDFTTFAGDVSTVDITLQGKKNEINKISSSSVKAYVIVTGVTEAGQYTFDIRYEGLPSGVIVKKSSASWLQVYVGTKKEEDFALTVEVINADESQDYEFETVPSVSSVSVSGPSSTVNKIVSAKLLIDVEGMELNKSFTHNGSIVLYDENGDVINSRYLEITPDTVSAEVKVIAEREIPVSVRFKHGLVSVGDCDITVDTATVKARGEISALKDAKAECIIDEKTVKNGSAASYPLTSSSGIELDASSVSVSVTFKNSAEKKITVTPEPINGKATLSPVTVTVRGSSDLISRITASDITATADVSNAMSGNNVKVEFTFEGEFNGKVYEVYESGEPYTAFVTPVMS